MLCSFLCGYDLNFKKLSTDFIFLFCNQLKIVLGLPTNAIEQGGVSVMDNSSLAHTKWNCKYHIVFAPKYRRQIIYGKIKTDIGRILRELCEYKKVEIIEANACKEHIHMLVSIPPKLLNSNLFDGNYSTLFDGKNKHIFHNI